MTQESLFAKLDRAFISECTKANVWFARFSLFIVYFWFGLLKLVAESPANPLVESLLERTLPFITFEQFIIVLGVGETLLGILFLIPRLSRLAIILLAIHMVTTIMPLFLLPTVAWQSFLVPTLEGQYIIKNILIIALALVIASHMKPMRPAAPTV